MRCETRKGVVVGTVETTSIHGGGESHGFLAELRSVKPGEENNGESLPAIVDLSLVVSGSGDFVDALDILKEEMAGHSWCICGLQNVVVEILDLIAAGWRARFVIFANSDAALADTSWRS